MRRKAATPPVGAAGGQAGEGRRVEQSLVAAHTSRPPRQGGGRQECRKVSGQSAVFLCRSRLTSLGLLGRSAALAWVRRRWRWVSTSRCANEWNVDAVAPLIGRGSRLEMRASSPRRRREKVMTRRARRHAVPRRWGARRARNSASRPGPARSAGARTPSDRLVQPAGSRGRGPEGRALGAMLGGGEAGGHYLKPGDRCDTPGAPFVTVATEEERGDDVFRPHHAGWESPIPRGGGPVRPGGPPHGARRERGRPPAFPEGDRRHFPFGATPTGTWRPCSATGSST